MVAVGVGVGVVVAVGVGVGVVVAMIDALLLLLDRNAHPDSLEDTALAALQLKNVTHVHRLPQGAKVDVDAYRAHLEEVLRRMDEERLQARLAVPFHLAGEVYDDGA